MVRGGGRRARCVEQRVPVTDDEHDTYGPCELGLDFNRDFDVDRDFDDNVLHDDEHRDRDHTGDEQLVDDDKHKHLVTHHDVDDRNVNDSHARADRTSHLASISRVGQRNEAWRSRRRPPPPSPRERHGKTSRPRDEAEAVRDARPTRTPGVLERDE